MHFTILRGSPRAFSVQVRVAYFLLLVCGQWRPLAWIYWIPLAGTWALVLVGYCPLARFLSLATWNRRVPLTGRLIARTFFTPPVEGSILNAPWRQPSPDAAGVP